MHDHQPADALLRCSEERYRTLFDAIDQGFCIIEILFDEQQVPIDYRFLEINPRFEAQTGLYQAVGKTARQLLPDLEEHWFEIYGQVALTGEPVRFENGSDAMNRWFDVYACRVGGADSRQVALLFRDISERKRMEAEREQLLQREQAARVAAEQANRLKDEFLAVLSHELRTPLNPILGWTTLLQNQTLSPDKTAQALDIIERNARLQTQLIDDLLDIARILRGKLRLEREPVRLLPIVTAALDGVKQAAAAKQITVHPVLSQRGTIFGDAGRLQQVVSNLLSNAIKFTPTGGQVYLQLVTADGWVQLTVRDTGQGIRPEFLPYIFESFRQADVSISRQHGGLGLGLAIVHQLVKAHGGTIQADSPGEGKGATFTVCLPQLPDQYQTQPETESVAAAEPDLSGIRVLLVDDEPDGRELLEVALSHCGAEVRSVATGAAVLEALNTFQPDVLVSDISMPDMDGYTLLRQVRSQPAQQGGQVPAIALTAYAREEDRQRAFDCGYQRHMSKPVEIERLMQVVQALVEAPAVPPA